MIFFVTRIADGLDNQISDLCPKQAFLPVSADELFLPRLPLRQKGGATLDISGILDQHGTWLDISSKPTNKNLDLKQNH